MDTPNDTTELKRCTFCEKWFPRTRDHFVLDKSKPDGFHPRCHGCKHKRRDPASHGFSRCSKCKTVKPVDQFSMDKRRNKPASWCKRCACEGVKAKYVPSTRVLLAPEEKKRRKSTRDANYAKKNQTKIKKYRREYYADHSEEVKRKVKEWTSANKERVKTLNKQRKAMRRAREIAAEGFFTVEDIRIAYRAQRGKCWHCFKPVGSNFHPDHLISLKHGGTNWPNNIVISCPACNLSKGSKSTQEWNGRLF